MPERDLIINLKLDRSQAKRQSDAFHDAERKQIDKTKEAHDKSVKQQVIGLESLAASGIKLQDKLQKAAEKRAQESVKALEKERAALEASAASATRFAVNMGTAVASFVGLSSASAVVSTIADSFERAREAAYRASEMVTDYRNALLELAALKGNAGQTSSALAEEVTFRARTLQTRQDATSFQLAALGVGESSIDNDSGKRLLSREEFNKAMTLGGAFQGMEKGSAEAHGTLVGLIPSLIGKRTTGEEVFQRESQLFKIFQPGGFSFTSGAQQFSKLAPLITAGQYKDTEAAALLSAFSTTNREGAGENVQQFTRATIGSIGKMRAGSMEGGEKVGEYLKSLGIDEKFTKSIPTTSLPFAIADKVVADLEAKESAAKAKGESFSALEYLGKSGYGALEDRNVLLQYYGLKKTGALKDTFMPLAQTEAQPTVEQALLPIATAQARDPALLSRKANLAEELATIGVGAGQNEYAEAIQKLAFSRIKKDIGFDKYEDVRGLSSWSPTEIMFGPKGKVYSEAFKMLQEEGTRVGVSQEEIQGVSSTFGKGEAGVLWDLGKLVAARGGNVMPGMGLVQGQADQGLNTAAAFAALGAQKAAADQMLKLLTDIRDDNRKQMKPDVPPARLRGAPPVQDRN